MDENLNSSKGDIADVFMGVPASKNSEMDELNEYVVEETNEPMNEELSQLQLGTSPLLDTLDDNPNSPFLDQLSPEDYFSEYEDITRFSFNMDTDATQSESSAHETDSESDQIYPKKEEKDNIMDILEAAENCSEEEKNETNNKTVTSSSLNFGEMAYLAMINSSNNVVSVQEIHDFMIFHFPCFEGDSVQWRLSIKEFFENEEYFRSYKMDENLNSSKGDIADVFMGVPASKNSEMDELNEYVVEETNEPMNEELSQLQLGTSPLLDTLDDNPNSPFLDQLSPEDYFSEYEDITRFSFNMDTDATQSESSAHETDSESDQIYPKKEEKDNIMDILEAAENCSEEEKNETNNKTVTSSSLNFGEMAYLAMINSSNNVVSVQEIHDFMIFHFPCFEGDSVQWRLSIKEFFENEEYFRSYKVEDSSEDGTYYEFTSEIAKRLLKENIEKTIEKHGIESIGMKNIELLNSILEGTDGIPKDGLNKVNQEMHDNEKKPCLNYIQLVFLAIINSPNQRAMAAEIYQFLAYHFPFFSHEETAWHNTIRSTLAKKHHFQSIQTFARYQSYSVTNQKAFDKMKESIEKKVEIEGVEALELRNKDLYRNIIEGTAGMPTSGSK